MLFRSALEEVLDKSNPFNKIIIVRSAVQSREMGHLPGDVDEKMEIYQQATQEITDKVRDSVERMKTDRGAVLGMFRNGEAFPEPEAEEKAA